MGIVSLKYDFAFKHLMRNEEVRRQFVGDVLGIPLEQIRSVRLGNPFLWKMFFWQKQGILDILLLLNDDRKVNVELQVRILRHWDRRTLFYLSKMFTEDLLVGQDYTKLKKCVSISILDFNLDDSPKYHRRYRLLDEDGNVFSDLFEVHVIELRKKLGNGGQVDDWIRLLNAETEEDLEMIKTSNPGILEAIRELRAMGLVRNMRALYEARQKQIRDQLARDDYVRDEGIAIGEAIGEARGEARGEVIGETRGKMCILIGLVRKKLAKNMPAEDIADMLEQDPGLIEKICQSLKEHPKWNDGKVYEELTKSS